MDIPRVVLGLALFGIPTFATLLFEPQGLVFGPFSALMSMFILLIEVPVAGLALTAITGGSIYSMCKRRIGFFALGSTTLFGVSAVSLFLARAALF